MAGCGRWAFLLLPFYFGLVSTVNPMIRTEDSDDLSFEFARS